MTFFDDRATSAQKKLNDLTKLLREYLGVDEKHVIRADMAIRPHVIDVAVRECPLDLPRRQHPAPRARATAQALRSLAPRTAEWPAE